MTTGIPPQSETKSSSAVTDDIFSKFAEALVEGATLDADLTRRLIEIAKADASPTPARIEVVLREAGSEQ